MGLACIDGKVSHQKASAAQRFLVDGGATYTVLPQSVWKKLKLTPKRAQSFILADGTVMKRKVSECHTPVILGEKNDEAVLGAVTVEELAVILNPFERKLQPIQARLG